MKTGHTHVLNSLGFAELGKDGTYLVDQVGSNPFRIVPFEEPFQALVPKADCSAYRYTRQADPTPLFGNGTKTLYLAKERIAHPEKIHMDENACSLPRNTFGFCNWVSFGNL